jgi:type I restriction enzyme S subunit
VSEIERVRVGDVLRLERIPVTPDPTREYIAIGARSFGRGLFHYEPAKGDNLGSLRFFEVRPQRLVISNIKAWEGAVAVSSDHDARCVASNRFLQYAPVDGRVNIDWVRWFFLSEPGNELLSRASPGSADRNRTLAIKRFESLVIPLPPIEEQRRAAGRINRVDTRGRTALASSQDQPPPELIALIPQLVSRRLSRLPHSTTRVRDLADLVSDIVHPGDDPDPASSFVGLQHVERHTGRLIGSDPLESFKGRKFRFAPGDVLYGYLRPYLNKVWAADRHGLCSVDQYVLRPKPGVPAEMLAVALRSQSVLDRTADLTHSLQLPRVRSGLLLDLEMAWPSEATHASALEELCRLTAHVRKLAVARGQQTATLQSLVSAVLNQEFNGYRD